MPIFQDPFDAKAPLSRRCRCGGDHNEADHARLTASVIPSGEEERWNRVVDAAVLRAVFPIDAQRRLFLKTVGTATAMAAISSVLPLGLARDAFAQGGALEKKDLKVGFIPITCATPIIMAHPMGFYAKHGLNVEVVKTAGWAVIRDKALAKEYDAAHMLSPMPLAISLGVGSTATPWTMPAIENINGQAITLSIKHKDKRDPKQWKGFKFAVPFDYSERRVRAAIAQAPKGVFYGEDALDDDGLSEDPLPVKAKVTIADDHVEIDFEGTCGQIKRPLNCPYSSTLSAALSCVKSVLTSPDIPYNEGMVRPITIKVPYGSLLNPRPPAPVRARMIPAYRAFNAVMKALAQALPDKVIATGFDCTTAFCLSHLGEKGYSVYLEIFGGGYGASQGSDGCDAVDSPLSNCSNAPVESLDIDYDFFRITGYQLAPDSFGMGARRGGTGFSRRCEILKDDVQLAIYSDRFRLAPQGLLGGEPGTRGYCRVRRADGTVEDLKSKAALDLNKGDTVEMFVGGGAGFGRVAERPDALIERDLADGLLTRDPRTARKLAAE